MDNMLKAMSLIRQYNRKNSFVTLGFIEKVKAMLDRKENTLTVIDFIQKGDKGGKTNEPKFSRI